MKKLCLLIIMTILLSSVAVMAINATTTNFTLDTFGTVISSNEAASSGYDAQTTTGIGTATNGTTTTYTFSTSTTNTTATGVTNQNYTAPEPGDGGTTPASITVTTEEEDPYNIELTEDGAEYSYAEDDEIVLNIGDNEFTLQLTSIDDKSIIFYIVDQDKSISIGENSKKKADLDGDGLYDVFITVTDATESGTVTLFFELYSQAVDLAEEIEEAEVLTEEEQEAVFEEEALEDQEIKTTNWQLIGAIVLAIILIGLIVLLVGYFRNKK